MDNNVQETLKQEIARREWMITDAKRRLQTLAQEMQRKSEHAVRDCEKLMADEPTSICWMDFMEGVVRDAKEAKARLESLLREKQTLEFVLKQG